MENHVLRFFLIRRFYELVVGKRTAYYHYDYQQGNIDDVFVLVIVSFKLLFLIKVQVPALAFARKYKKG